MNPLAAIGGVFGLGVAGLDPFGALIVVPALATGTRRRVVLLFFGAAFLTTVLTGVVLGESVQYVSAWLGDGIAIPDPVRLVVQLFAGACFALWATRRWARRNNVSQEKGSKSILAGPVGMLVAGIFWGVSALTDPSFYGVATIATGLQNTLGFVLAFSGWFLVSQAPLCLVVLTLAAGRGSRPVQCAVAFAQRIARPAGYAMTALLAVVALLLILNGLTYLGGAGYWPL